MMHEDAVCVDLPVASVSVWYVFTNCVTDAAVLDRYGRIMSEAERKRRDRFVFAKDRHAFVVTRGLVRNVLSRYTRIPPEACVFDTNRYGKPSLRCRSTGAALEFNLSHTDGLAAMAVTVGRDIGIDVENMTRSNLELDVSRYFSTAEIRMLQSTPQSEQTSRFFDYWTLKEAYIKARGIGLSLPLDGFSMHMQPGRPLAIEFSPAIDDDPSTWQFVLCNPTPCHRMALAIRRRGPDIPVKTEEFDATRAVVVGG
jgi:4'-phosphopantetheinyl transferase